MGDFTMPALGADMEEGTLQEWLVHPGDQVHKGDLVAVVDTDKAAIEVESFQDGIVETLVVEPGTRVPVGAVLARFSTTPPGPADVHATPPPATPPPATPLVRRVATELGVDLAAVAGTGPGGRISRSDVVAAAAPPVAPVRAPGPSRGRITPYARRLAAELGVDPTELASRVDGGAVRAADVRRAAPAARAPAPRRTADPKRAAIATVMARSKREIPHYYLSTTVDLESALAWMQRRNNELEIAQRLVPAALFLKATALAATEVPEVNGFWTEGGFRPGEAVHLGVAVHLRGGGLVAPGLHDAANLGLVDLMAQLRDLVTRARRGRLRNRELTEPTLSVTNLGDLGVESVHGIIQPPQVALVGFGAVVRRPWAVGELLGIRPVTTLTLSADHRATDGFTGGRFLAAIEQHLQQPEAL